MTVETFGKESAGDLSGTHLEFSGTEEAGADDHSPDSISLDDVLQDEPFRVRPDGDLSLLATDLARLGQMFPIDVREVQPGRYQIICGHRRVAALRFLQRERVFARIHLGLSDEDALLMAIADAIDVEKASAEHIYLLQERLRAEGRLTPTAKDMLEKALSAGEQLAPEMVEDEIDADKLSTDVTMRLGEINQDLSLLADVFTSLDGIKRDELLRQLRYSADLVAFLESK